MVIIVILASMFYEISCIDGSWSITNNDRETVFRNRAPHGHLIKKMVCKKQQE